MSALAVYSGSDAAQTRAYYVELQARGPIGVVALNLFRAQKCSARAKVYRGGVPGKGSYRRMAYDRKAWSLENLSAALVASGEELGIRFGWKLDPAGYAADWVLYVDLPEGQVSFHSTCRYAGPDYPRDWDGKHASAERILAFCDRVMRMTVAPQFTLWP